MPLLLFPRHSPVGAPVEEEPTAHSKHQQPAPLRRPSVRPPVRQRVRATDRGIPIKVSYGKVPERVFADAGSGSLRLIGSSTDELRSIPNLPVIAGYSTDEFETAETREAEELLALALAIGDDDLVVLALALMDGDS